MLEYQVVVALKLKLKKTYKSDVFAAPSTGSKGIW